MDVVGKHQVFFNVRACQHISILLSAIKNNVFYQTHMIEIQRENDNMTVIRDAIDGNIQDSAQIPDILSCINYK